MPRGVYNRKARMQQDQTVNLDAVNIAAAGVANLANVPFVQMEPDRSPSAPAPEPVKMFPVKLSYNYRPQGDYKAVGWHKPAVEKKNAAGQMIVVEPAEFITGEVKPAPVPGVGFEHKIWAGSVIELPLGEARELIKSRRAERADDIPA